MPRKNKLSPEEREQRKKARVQKFLTEKMKNVNFRLNLEKDKEILDYLSKIDNKTDYFRKLIRKEMKKD